jgi:hypothetical protein
VPNHCRCFTVRMKPRLSNASIVSLFAAVLFAVGSAHVVHAAEKSVYQTGKLTDLQRHETGAGAGRAQGSFCFAIELGDMTYLARHEATWRWSYEPTDFVVGDPVEVRIKGNDLYLKKRKGGGDLKTSITRRERNTPDKPAANCALPVTNRN